MRLLRLPLLALALLVTALALAPPAVAKGDNGCSDSLEGLFDRTPATIAGPLDPSLLANYAVLRRPATAVDLPPPINSLSNQVDFALGSYYPAYIRQLAQSPGGRRFFLVPGFPVHMPVPPARCLPAHLRPKRPELVKAQLERERQPIACIVTMSARTGGGEASYGPGNCPPFGELTTYEYLASGVYGGSDQVGILPDGIAAVRVHFSHAATVQVAVVANFYRYKLDPVRYRKLIHRIGRTLRRLYGPHRVRAKAVRRRLQRQLTRTFELLSPKRIELLAANGGVIKVVKRPKDLGFDGPFRR